ncbi:hypothetical protein H8M10_11620 [Stenotrophomonas maltophilia]|uniref:hypothetical protein n=1 Tax=Stenotrophomonas maltophilia TaxID=40324 RepID=UPI000CF337D3|nr:hypothetical protein [Stenotrophomonas maltophilia]AVH89349.1 hypothetical protein AL480_00285 [Stenotrophomonas maltophilia]MBH1864786.1 hypothetical protein [Stenotrophomonas maltophilia]MBK1557668.1 hypothetical protein [Stenotrophomonas maltophilia]MBN5036970.1 hypothetical protein [Stenotrophomonas maltophilia]MBN5086960.1 hypothetical protein [Stenotrophomonas maltophilia]
MKLQGQLAIEVDGDEVLYVSARDFEIAESDWRSTGGGDRQYEVLWVYEDEGGAFEVKVEAVQSEGRITHFTVSVDGASEVESESDLTVSPSDIDPEDD